MKKHLLLLTVFATLCLLLQAQEPDYAALQKLVESNRVTANYSFTYEGKVHCNGVITIQRPCFKASGNGIEVYCDGKTRWTVDPESKEVYIEAAGSAEDYLSYLTEISDMRIEKVKSEPMSPDLKSFVFDTGAIDSSWVVTDLR